jgi:DNA polymerase-3 subunit chi
VHRVPALPALPAGAAGAAGAGAEAGLAEELAAVRPDLLARYAAELPGARAAVLTRLWRALAHEPLPWITGRERTRDGLLLRLRDGRRLHGPAADPYATGPYAPVVHLEGAPHGDPARLMADLAVPHADAFAAELGHSAASLALSRAGQPVPPPHAPKERPADGWRTGRDNGWEAEQRVVDGHPFHPGCRSRPGFSAAEQLAYAPEHRPVVTLRPFAVPEETCLVTGAWPAELRDGRRILLPVHPWQAEHVLKQPHGPRGGARPYDGACARPRGEEQPYRARPYDGEPPPYEDRAGGSPAHPLMSLRTLAVPGGPHVKTALSARLTSSVRDISVYSVTVSAALSAFAEHLVDRLDGLLHVTRTLGAATAHSPDLAAVLRESPQVHAGPGEHVLPVAALATTSLPASPAWLADLARLALGVGLRLLELGVALEAHGQNLLVVLSASGAPLRLVYRDLADIRISPARLARHGIPAPPITGRLVTDDVTTLRRKLFGSLVAGALAGVAGSGPRLRAALAAAVRDLPRGPDLAALCAEPLPAKALTLMRLSPDRQGDLWTLLPNPLSGEG